MRLVCVFMNFEVGALGRIRTCDPQHRKLMLYPLSYERPIHQMSLP